MKNTLVALCASIALTTCGMTASAWAGDTSPTIEVAFVLDTTSSMSELIEGAKRKIWTIARQMVSGTPAPAIKLGLVGYRDRGDEYVTRTFDLSSDLDLIYGQLAGFRAVGGNDWPESVNQALHEAVTRLSWSKDPATLKMIFLVGDAAPHMDYADDVKYPETLRLAAASGIVVNTIQCGQDAQAAWYWQDIARLASGAYVKIEQSGGMRRISSPVDAELSRLSRELSGAVVPYGDAAKQTEVRTKAVAAERADHDRLVVMNLDRADFGAKVVVTGDGELIWDVVNRKVKLEEIPDSDLPVILQGKTLEEKTRFVAEQFEKRKELQIKVDALSAERDRYVKAETEKLAGARDSFDARVAEIIQTQAQQRGIQYDLTATK